VACALDIVGDRWTLLVIRDLLYRGSETFSQLAAAPERIPTNVLSERLSRLMAAGLVTREPYQERPVRYRYRLTERGRALRPLMGELARWGKAQFPGTRTLQ